MSPRARYPRTGVLRSVPLICFLAAASAQAGRGAALTPGRGPAPAPERAPVQDPAPVEDPAGPPVPNPAEGRGAAAEQAREQALEQARRDRTDLLRVDALLDFTRLAGERALEMLATERDPDRRAAAIFALGAARVVTSRPQLVLWAQEGPAAQREAALFALGEMGSYIADGEAVLFAALDLDDARLGAAALIALRRTESSSAVQLVQEIAGSPSHPLHSVGESLLEFLEDRLTQPLHPSIVGFFELREEAAKWFGTIDGQTWRMRLVDRLRDDESYLDHVVLLSAADLDLPGLHDHLLEILLTSRRAVRIRAAVRAMPGVVERLVENELWVPRNPGEWRVLVDSAVEEGVADRMPRTLERASRLPALAPLTLGILAGDEPTFDEPLLTALESPLPRQRELAAFGIGEGGGKHFLARLVALGDDPDLRVRATAYAARLRLGDDGGAAGLRRILVEERGDHSAQDRLVVIEVLHAASRSPRVLDLLLELTRVLEGVERAGVIASVHLRRRTIDMSPLRDVLEGLDLDTPIARRMVEALGYLPRAEDLAWLASRFPIENGGEGNVELGVALARNGHPKFEPILRHAVWVGPWNRSVLSAAVVKEHSGMRVLEHWVTKPPVSATSEDIRRVGFAIGEWGGLEAVDNLTRRLSGVGGADRPAIQGALLGALSGRTH